jgi:hypothetical protein
MDNHLNFPPIHLPTTLPSTTDMLVTLQNDPSVVAYNIPNPLTPKNIPNTDQAWAALHTLHHIRETLTLFVTAKMTTP